MGNLWTSVAIGVGGLVVGVCGTLLSQKCFGRSDAVDPNVAALASRMGDIAAAVKQVADPATCSPAVPKTA
jgi:hypothetical protein